MEIISYHIWFYLGILAIIVGIYLIAKSSMRRIENGYFLIVIGLIGVLSEWMDFSDILFILLLIAIMLTIYGKINRTNHAVIYAKDILPVLLVVFILRAFLFEVYQIPSSSMRPDLTVGDFILVNKFDYGIRAPLDNHILIPIHQVKRGDVIVFKDQLVKNRDLIKRVIGVGGDTVVYKNKRLTINNIPLPYVASGTYSYVENIPDTGKVTLNNDQYTENIFGVSHKIITYNLVPPLFASEIQNFKYKNNCTYYGNEGFSCIVPNGYYFVMGDNRDNSFDSRYWGFVPNGALLGHATYVLFNMSALGSRLWKKI